MKEWYSRNFNPETSRVAFCHNDLNAHNIFIIDGEKGKTSLFIDFEYSAYNYIAYDLANFLNETTISYVSEFPGF